METFLKQVARHILRGNGVGVKKRLVVFPNRRSMVFFTQACRDIVDEVIWMPKLTTISDFVTAYSSLSRDSDISLLFELYNTYKRVSGSKESFDQFFHWGEILLKDFDDIDKYLVDPKAVFSNVKDIKDLDRPLDYLTEDQIIVLKTFFKSFSDMGYTSLQKSFLEVWEVMLEVYEGFNAKLLSKNKTYEGAQFKLASKAIKDVELDDIPKVSFVGFNAITKCEEEIFGYLKKHNKATFYWDYDPYYIDNKYHQAGMLLRKHIDIFSMPDDFELKSDITGDKKIEVVEASTDHGQIAVAGSLLQDVAENSMSNTALVLANEELLFPVLNNLPRSITKVNPTMGYPLSKSNVGTFIDLFFRLHQNTRKDSEGNLSFYHVYVTRLLKHPFLQMVDRDLVDAKLKDITDNNLFYIRQSELLGHRVLEKTFVEIGMVKDLQLAIGELLNVIMLEYVEGVDENKAMSLDLEMLFEALKSHNQLMLELDSASIELEIQTYCRVFIKILQMVRVPFEGEPLEGMQLMGFLETRNLDFDKVIVVSSNEGQLPLSQMRPSFIPYSLRKGFGLPVTELHDAMYAYYFYRLLQRSKDVTLIYSSSESGMESGEKSRFVSQLLFDDSFSVNTRSIKQAIESSGEVNNRVEKNKEVRLLLKKYVEGDSKKRISPSAIVRYMMCPLKFYYYSLLGLYEPDEVEEKVDARIFGNMFHKSAEILYQNFVGGEKPITKSILAELSKGGNLKKVINEAFMDSFYRKNRKEFKIQGKNIIVESVLEKYLSRLLELEQNDAPFLIEGAEGEFFVELDFDSNGDVYSVRLGGTIDRVDRVRDGVRIIDYKTGNDELVFNELKDVFNPVNIKKQKAIMQTLIYSYVYAVNNPQEAVIMPCVLQVKKLFVPNTSFRIESRKEEAFASGNFVDIFDGVEQNLKRVLSEIFDITTPFEETLDRSNCEYCAYKVMCGR